MNFYNKTFHVIEYTDAGNCYETWLGTVNCSLSYITTTYRCINITCDQNQTLDTSFDPPKCVDNPPECDEEDTSFPALKNQEAVIRKKLCFEVA